MEALEDQKDRLIDANARLEVVNDFLRWMQPYQSNFPDAAAREFLAIALKHQGNRLISRYAEAMIRRDKEVPQWERERRTGAKEPQ